MNNLMLQVLNCKSLLKKAQKTENIFFNFFLSKLRKENFATNNFLKFFESGLILNEFLINININRYSDELITLNKNLLKVAFLIKKNIYFRNETLVDISVYDVPGVNYRFTFTYLFNSIKNNSRINLLIKTNELNPVDSLMHIFPGACWVEREIWDLFGIFFFNHDDLRRILTDYNFEGHPLRKDFPLSGYNDLFYDDKYKKVVQVPVEFAQELRVFTFNNSWKPAP